MILQLFWEYLVEFHRFTAEKTMAIYDLWPTSEELGVLSYLQ
jgi:hypothetical protein